MTCTKKIYYDRDENIMQVESTSIYGRVLGPSKKMFFSI